MKFFIDTADLEEIRQAKAMGVLDGVTTNPSLVKKAGGADFHEHIDEICEIAGGRGSAEVVSVTYEDILSEARQLASIHQYMVVKVPLIAEGIKAIETLTAEAIRTNRTLISHPPTDSGLEKFRADWRAYEGSLQESPVA